MLKFLHLLQLSNLQRTVENLSLTLRCVEPPSEPGNGNASFTEIIPLENSSVANFILNVSNKFNVEII